MYVWDVASAQAFMVGFEDGFEDWAGMLRPLSVPAPLEELPEHSSACLEGIFSRPSDQKHASELRARVPRRFMSSLALLTNSEIVESLVL